MNKNVGSQKVKKHKWRRGFDNHRQTANNANEPM